MTARIRREPLPDWWAPDSPHPGVACLDEAFADLAPEEVPHWWAPDPPEGWPGFWGRMTHQRSHTDWELKVRERDGLTVQEAAQLGRARARAGQGTTGPS